MKPLYKSNLAWLERNKNWLEKSQIKSERQFLSDYSIVTKPVYQSKQKKLLGQIIDANWFARSQTLFNEKKELLNKKYEPEIAEIKFYFEKFEYVVSKKTGQSISFLKPKPEKIAAQLISFDIPGYNIGLNAHTLKGDLPKCTYFLRNNKFKISSFLDSLFLTLKQDRNIVRLIDLDKLLIDVNYLRIASHELTRRNSLNNEIDYLVTSEGEQSQTFDTQRAPS